LPTLLRAKRHSSTEGNLMRLPPKGQDLASLRPDLAQEWDYELNDLGPECFFLTATQTLDGFAPRGINSQQKSTTVQMVRNVHFVLERNQFLAKTIFLRFILNCVRSGTPITKKLLLNTCPKVTTRYNGGVRTVMNLRNSSIFVLTVAGVQNVSGESLPKDAEYKNNSSVGRTLRWSISLWKCGGNLVILVILPKLPLKIFLLT